MAGLTPVVAVGKRRSCLTIFFCFSGSRGQAAAIAGWKQQGEDAMVGAGAGLRQPERKQGPATA